MIVFLLILLILILVALSFDIVPLVFDAFWCMKIGSLKDKAWFEAASHVAQKWCARGLPEVPRVAGKRLQIIDRLKNDYKSTTIQSWQTGSVLLSVNELNPQISKEAATKYIDPETGEWLKLIERVDFAFLAYSLLDNEYIDPDSIKPAMDSMASLLLEKFKKFGSIPYSQNPDHRYVDTIGLVCPFLMKYSLVYGKPDAMKAAVSIIDEYEQNGLHDEFSVPVHCFNAKTKAPLGLYSWGRGCGWWAIGLAESFRILNETDSDSYIEEKKLILKNMLSFSKTMLAFQSNNGSFDRNIFAHSGADSSATAMIAYMLAYSGELAGREDFTVGAKKAMSYIYSVTRRNGTVDYSQGDTMGIGFYSQESIVLPATQGFALKTYMMLNKE
ncbi:MAG: glycoside hydrolase family 88 protein [Clostridia bacterium]|nr:glycoside hydrolase family 88 protein [Clostridia bacterium]